MNEHIERIPPNSQDAERAVIGSMLIDKEAVIKVLELLTSESFYIPNHQIIFKAIFDLFNIGHAVDLVTVSDHLRNKGILDNIGGYIYLIDLAESVPTTANVENYARIVEEKFIKRELIKMSGEISQMAYESTDDISKILDKSEQQIFSIGQKRFTKDLMHIKQLLIENFEVFNRDYPEERTVDLVQKRVGISTGISDLDRVLTGLNPSDLIILAARPSMGKTSFCLNIASNIAFKEKLPIAIFSLEMSKEQITQRIISSEAEISAIRLKTGDIDKDQWKRIATTIGKLYDAPIYIDDTSNLTPIEIRAKVRRLKAEHKRLGCVVIDYLQLMETKASEVNRVQEIAKITRALKGLAREMDVPVIALSQLSRTVEQRQNKRPQLSDLRESGSIEQDADIVMFIYRDEYYNPDTDKKKVAEILISKNRNGEIGKVELYFNPVITKFTALTDFKD